MRSRMLTLMLAVVTGAVAVAIVYLYVQNVEEESVRGRRPVSVLVANRTIPAGTSWTDIEAAGLAVTKEIPEAFAAPGVLSSFGDRTRGVLAREVIEGEQLTHQAFAATAQKAFADQFAERTEALALPVERVRGVAGHVAANDRLNAFRTTESGTELIAKRIRVVEVQPPLDGDPAGVGMIVLEVERKEALDLINAQEQAGLWFTLVPGGDL
jgi:pilus assembly protein CpaB